MAGTIELKKVTREYLLGKLRVNALRKVDLTIKEGEFLAIEGPSGSGKTTLLNLIGLIDIPTSGEISIDGMEVSRMNDRRRTRLRLDKIGFIFQTFNLISVLNVLENVEFPLLLKKEIKRKTARIKAENLIEEVGLTPFIRHRPAELSGGQRQRVAIARALVTRPALILADEPTANLDSATGGTIVKLMREINQSHKTTFIFSTHDPAVLKHARRRVKLKDGAVSKS